MTHTTYRIDGTAARKLNRPAHLVLVYDRGVQQTARPQYDQSSRVRDNRMLLACCLLVAMLVMSIGFIRDQHHAQAVTTRLDEASAQVIRVGQGETLWHIAEEHPVSGVSTQELVTWITTTNDLSSSMLTPGQTLSIPAIE